MCRFIYLFLPKKNKVILTGFINVFEETSSMMRQQWLAQHELFSYCNIPWNWHFRNEQTGQFHRTTIKQQVGKYNLWYWTAIQFVKSANAMQCSAHCINWFKWKKRSENQSNSGTKRKQEKETTTTATTHHHHHHQSNWLLTLKWNAHIDVYDPFLLSFYVNCIRILPSFVVLVPIKFNL